MTAHVSVLRAHYRAVRTRLWKPEHRAPVLTLVRAKPVFRYLTPIGPLKATGRDVLWLATMGPQVGRAIIRDVCLKHNVSVNDVMSPRRGKAIVLARKEACWRLRHETTWSLPRIGEFMGGKDHTTVLHAVRSYEELLKGRNNGDKAQANDGPVCGGGSDLDAGRA